MNLGLLGSGEVVPDGAHVHARPAHRRARMVEGKESTHLLGGKGVSCGWLENVVHARFTPDT